MAPVVSLPHKVALAAGVEQLRPNLALAAARQRLAMPATAAGMKGLATVPEDVLVFLKQQTMQTMKAAAAQSQIASQSLRAEQQQMKPSTPEGGVMKPPNPQENNGQTHKLDILDPNKIHSPSEPSKYPKI